MDKKDEAILKMLMENSRMPRTKMAELLGISETAVRKRIAKLEEEKVLLGYTAKINYKALNYSVSLTGVDVEPEKMWAVIENLKKIEGIKSIMLTSGDHMIMMEIIAKSVEKLSEIHRKIERLEGVKRICPAVVLDRIK